MRRFIVAVCALLGFGCWAPTGALGQNYVLGSYSVNRVITASSNAGASYTYAATSGGGTVTASASTSGPGQSSSASVKVEFSVVATYVGGQSPPPTGSVTAKDTATGHASFSGGARVDANSGYEYSPWLSIYHSIGEANPYSFNESHGMYGDAHGTTTLYIIAGAGASVNAVYSGSSGSAYADSTVTMTIL